MIFIILLQVIQDLLDHRRAASASEAAPDAATADEGETIS